MVGCGRDCEKFRINNCMKTVYLIPKARNSVTKESVAHMELSGQRFALHERVLVQQLADRLAAQLTARTTQLWTGYVDRVNESNRA